MIVYTIVDRGESTQDGGNRFSMSEVTRTGSVHSSGNEITLPSRLLTHVPSRLLIEELGIRVNVYMATEDAPDPVVAPGGWCWNMCDAFGTDAQTSPGAHHSAGCSLYNAG